MTSLFKDFLCQGGGKPKTAHAYRYSWSVRASTTVLLSALLGASAGHAGTLAPSYTDFEESGFVAGNSINDTDPVGNNVNISNINNCVQAWRVGNAGPTTEDEEIVDISGSDAAHGKVWRFSQGASHGTLGSAPQSPNNGNATPLTAGETGAANDAGCGAVTSANFYGELQFKSVTGATQDDLAISVTAASADRRHAYVYIRDDGTGLDLLFYDTDETGAFIGTEIDTNLSYTEWHTLGIEIFFADGLGGGGEGNDVVNVYVDNVLVHTGTTWETFYAVVASDPPQSVDRMQFSSGDVIASQLGNGLYFDNVLVTDTCPAGHCGSTQAIDHYACYDVQERTRLPWQNVTLRDQFGPPEDQNPDNATVRRAEVFCTPVDKNGEGVISETLSLVCYDVKGRDWANAKVAVSNQFGDQELLVKQRVSLCVPSTSEIVGSGPPHHGYHLRHRSPPHHHH